MRSLLLVLLALLLPAFPAAAQGWHATFADGTFQRPPWAGDTTVWRIVPFGTDRALHSAGPMSSDTLLLSLPSEVTYGTWEAVVRYEGGTLSTFNQARIFLMAASASRPHAGSGYHLQIGSNADDVRLYRSDGAGERTLLGASDTGILGAADARTLTVRVERSADEAWRVWVDGALAIDVRDPAPVAVTPSWFALWVKHTRARGADFWFDDLGASPGAASPAPGNIPEAGDLAINEILFAPDPAENEYVEVLNRSDRVLDLRPLTLSDNRDAPVPIARDAILLAPGAFAVLARDTALFARAFPGVNARQVAPWPALNNGDDSVVLRVGETVIDRVDYQGAWGEAGRSLERRDPAAPASFAGNWGASRAPEGGTPGRANTLFTPDTVPPSVLLAEATAPDTLLVIWNEPVDPASVAPARLDAGGAPRRVETLGATAHRLVFAAPIVAASLRVGGVADLAGNRIADAAVPIAYPPEAGELIVSEIMYEPRAAPDDGLPDQPEYVELQNAGRRRLSLRRVALAGPVDERGTADTLRHTAPYPQLDPGGHAVIGAGEGLRAAFPSMPDTAPVLAVAAATLGLGNSGDEVRVVVDDQVLDAVIFRPGWHYPLLADTRGIALERRAPDAPAGEAGSWTSSVDPEGGTPGRPNSVWQAAGPAPGAGTRVWAAPSPFSPDGDGHDDAARIQYVLPEAPAVLRVRIFDRAGRPVRQLAAGYLSGAEGTLIWDGTDDGGQIVGMGAYVVLLEALYTGQGRVEARKTALAVARTAPR